MTISNTKYQTGDTLPRYLPKLASTPESRAAANFHRECRTTNPIQPTRLNGEPLRLYKRAEVS